MLLGVVTIRCAAIWVLLDGAVYGMYIMSIIVRGWNAGCVSEFLRVVVGGIKWIKVVGVDVFCFVQYFV